MNRASLLKRAAALLVAPSLINELPAPAPPVATSENAIVTSLSPTGPIVAPGSLGDISTTPTGLRVVYGNTWLDDELVPIYASLKREHVAELNRRIYLGA